MSKKVSDALRKYYSTFDYGTGVKAYKKGGYMGFSPHKFGWGGPNGTTWIDEINQTPVSESDVDSLLALYRAENPGPWGDPLNNLYVDPAKVEGKMSPIKKLTDTVHNIEDGILSGFRNTKDSALSGSWSGLAGVATNIIGNTIGGFKSIDDSYKSAKRGINSFGKQIISASDNDSLMAAAVSPSLPISMSSYNFRNKSAGQDFGSALSNGLTAGLATGNLFVGLGATALSGLSSWAQQRKAEKREEEIRRLAKEKNRELDRRLFNASLNVDENNDAMRMLDYYNNPFEYALGGEMRSHGSDWNSGLTFINEGGRHEENPLEGVPSGIDDEGVPNLVEEGEVIWNNEYVFSDRLKVPKELANKYKLGREKTFAEAIEEVTKESRMRPNDPISNETNRAIVNEFMDAQEALREKEQAKAARQVQMAYDEDFMNQLAAMNQGGMPVQEGLQLPPQGMNEDGMPIEGAPSGFALGGNKFDNGSWKRYATEGTDNNGNTIYTTSDGRIFYSEAGAQKYIELNKERLISNLPNFEASPIPARIIANRTGVQLPKGIKVVYSKGKNGQKGPVHHYETSDGLNMGTDLDKAIRHQNALDGVNAPVQEATVPVVQETTLPNPVSSSTIPASTVIATRTFPAAQPQVQQVAQPQVAAQQVQPEVTINSKGQEEETLPDGIKVVYSKGRNGNRGPVHHYETSDGLNMGTNRNKAVQHQTRLNQGNTQVAASAKVVPSPSFQDINIFSTPDSGFDLFSYPPQDYVSAPVAQAAQPQNTSVPAEEQVAAQVAAASTSSNTSQASGRPSGRISGSAGSSTSSGNTIDYNRKLGLKASREWEAQDDYQNFLKYMRSNPNSLEAKQWMDFIQDEIRKRGSSYTLKDFDDWSKLAEDGKIGPVHQATLKAAQTYQRRSTSTQLGQSARVSGPTAVSPNTGSNIDLTKRRTDITPEDITRQSQFNYKDTWMRDVPIWAGLAGALYGMSGSPDYSNADAVIEAARAAGVPVNIPVQTIGDYRRRRPFDERYLVNMANQNMAAGQRSLYNTSGGNRAMDILGAMNLARGSQQNIGEIMRQAYLANRADDAQVADFNRGTNIQNMNAINQRNLSQAQLNSQRQGMMLSGLERGYGMRQAIKDAWDAATMQSLNSAITSIGLKGRENEQDNMLMSMAEQGYFPNYYRDRGIIDYVRPSAKGGRKSNKKKRRF